ncbi:MAG TPA: histidine kinase [Polyangia bacterium]|jgi:LytS/YehU family sensor histidine kinase
MVPYALPLLAGWSSVVVSIPLFAAAGWGLARHLELERRLEVHDVREVALRAALDDARLLALRARLDPHFLFNGLNLITELCREDPAEAERCVLRLSTLLRAALEQGERGLVPLGRELDLCADYLELCRVRFGARLAVAIARDPAADAVKVPSLAVQVLCENAVRHGVERRPAGGTVRIATTADATSVTVRVTSPGPCGPPRPGAAGLDLTRRRLALTYAGRAVLAVATAPSGDETVAALTLPRSAS